MSQFIKEITASIFCNKTIFYFSNHASYFNKRTSSWILRVFPLKCLNVISNRHCIEINWLVQVEYIFKFVKLLLKIKTESIAVFKSYLNLCWILCIKILRKFYILQPVRNWNWYPALCVWRHRWEKTSFIERKKRFRV